jgi:malonate transporter and related proteins
VSNVLAALAPVFLLILLGWGVRAARIFPADALGAVNRFGYFVLYPAFLFTTIAGASVASAEAIPFLLGVLVAFLCIVALLLALRPFFKDGPGYTSVFQGSTRWNGFAILAAGNEIFGAMGRPYIALIFGPAVLLLNIISVGVLARWGATPQTSWRYVFMQVAANPLVLACVAGLTAMLLGLPDMGPVSDALKLLGQAAMPVALICVGAGIDLSAARTGQAKVALACGLKLVAAPLVFWGVARGMGASIETAAIAAGIGSTPTAAASYALAREMGGDARLMAAIVSMTTLLSFITMPIAISLALGAR